MPHPLFAYYHRVQPWSRDPARRNLAVDPFSLRRHAAAIRRHGLTMTTASRAMAAGGRMAALTFDDGFADNLEHGAAALAEEGAVGTVYVVVSRIGTCEGRHAEAARMLTVEELRALMAAGWEIGSHTLTHPRLTDMDEPSQRREIHESKWRLEDLLGVGVASLAYPYGLYNATTLRLAEEAGYTNAVTTAKRGGDGSPFAVSRVSLGGYGLRAMKQVLKLRCLLWLHDRERRAS